MQSTEIAAAGRRFKYHCFTMHKLAVSKCSLFFNLYFKRSRWTEITSRHDA